MWKHVARKTILTAKNSSLFPQCTPVYCTHSTHSALFQDSGSTFHLPTLGTPDAAHSACPAPVTDLSIERKLTLFPWVTVSVVPSGWTSTSVGVAGSSTMRDTCDKPTASRSPYPPSKGKKRVTALGEYCSYAFWLWTTQIYQEGWSKCLWCDSETPQC